MKSKFLIIVLIALGLSIKGQTKIDLKTGYANDWNTYQDWFIPVNQPDDTWEVMHPIWGGYLIPEVSNGQNSVGMTINQLSANGDVKCITSPYDIFPPNHMFAGELMGMTTATYEYRRIFDYDRCANDILDAEFIFRLLSGGGKIIDFQLNGVSQQLSQYEAQSNNYLDWYTAYSVKSLIQPYVHKVPVSLIKNGFNVITIIVDMQPGTNSLGTGIIVDGELMIYDQQANNNGVFDLTGTTQNICPGAGAVLQVQELYNPNAFQVGIIDPNKMSAPANWPLYPGQTTYFIPNLTSTATYGLYLTHIASGCTTSMYHTINVGIADLDLTGSDLFVCNNVKANIHVKLPQYENPSDWNIAVWQGSTPLYATTPFTTPIPVTPVNSGALNSITVYANKVSNGPCNGNKSINVFRSLTPTPCNIEQGGGNDPSDPGRMSITGIVDQTNEGSIDIFPNPGNGIFKIRLNNSDAAGVSVFDYAGKEIYNNQMLPVNSIGELNLSEFPMGIYLVKVQTAGETSIKRIVIE